MDMIELIEKPSVNGWLLLEHRRRGTLWTRLYMGFRHGPNLVTTVGKAHHANLLIGTGTAPSHIALGTGTTAAAAADTALEDEKYREAATRTRVTISTTNDTSQYTYTFTIDATYDLTEAGLLSAASGGILSCHQIYTALSVESGDTLKATWRLQQ